MKKLLILLFVLISFTISAQTYELNDTITIPGVIINGSYSASRTTPFTFQNLSKTQINLSSQNNEPAILLSKTTPSISTYSESGTGLGYIYFRMRGIDQTRINSTFNGVPLNEPEDQGIYYNNYYGLLQSLSSLQVIRGAGISKPGVSSYGGSINFNPQEFSKKFSLKVQMMNANYNTSQTIIGVNSKNFFLNGALGGTNGYKYNTFNKSASFFYGVNHTFKKSEIRLYGFLGKQRNGQGWGGATLNQIYKDPRYNSNSPDEKDDFFQIHNQLVWKYNNLTTTLYHTHLNGKYGVESPDINNRGMRLDTINLKSEWFGANINYYILVTRFFTINTGVNSYTYTRDHFGTNNYVDQKPYYNSGTKTGYSPYAKGELKFSKLTLYGDIQSRYAEFNYTGDAEFNTKKYAFLDWSSGITFSINNNTRIYYGIGTSHKEPKRTDYFGGLENYFPGAYTDLVPEELLSNELGFKYMGEHLSSNLNFYYMQFKNEMSLTGNLGVNSISLSNINIDRSFRSGIELDASYIFKRLTLSTVSSISYNEITEGDFVGRPVLTPNTIVQFDAKYFLTKVFHIGINWKYNSESYIDFQNENILPSYEVLNMYAGIIWKHLELQGNLNNVTNNLILGSAYMYYDGTPRYYVTAGRNALVSLTVKF